MGVWIETKVTDGNMQEYVVTPFVGVWIETLHRLVNYCLCLVTPFVGVWIETLVPLHSPQRGPSHPSWVCGLKP